LTGAADIIQRLRARGANIVIDGGKLRVVNANKLPAGANDYIKQYGAEIAAELRREAAGDFEERAAIIEFDGGAPREWAEQFAALLVSRRPANVADDDWRIFVDACGAMVDALPSRAAA
jgi:hypothetical protein